ncbi:MAG: ABC transporter permease [Fulvivirga sp.]
MKPIPPHIALKFLRWFCREDYLHEVEGDLVEVFEKQYKQSPAKAKWYLYWSILRHFRPEFIRGVKSTNQASMFQTHLKLTHRNFMKYKSSFLINIIGLSLAITVSFLMFQYIAFERSYDSFHFKKELIFRVALDMTNATEHITTAQNYSAAGPSLKNDFPEIADFVRLYPATLGYNTCTISHKAEDKSVVRNQKKVYYADASFFTAFSFPLAYGNPQSVLSDPGTCVLSASMSQEYFGNTNPIGKTVEISFDGDNNQYKVSGVFQDLPYNSHFDFDFLLSYSSVKSDGFQSSWHWNEFYTYILLEDDVDYKDLEGKLDNFISTHMSDKHEKYGMSEHFFLQPVEDIHLKSDLAFEMEEAGNNEMIRLLEWMAIIILLFAWINYLNLSLSLLFKRTKEVGIKKVLGAQKKNIIKQVILEFAVLSIIALAISALLLLTSVPRLHNYFGDTFQHISIDFRFATLFFTAVIVGTIAFALIPGFFLSGIRPITVLKGTTIRFSKGLNIRKTFLLLQFAMSIIILVGVLTVFLQIRFLQGEELKMSLENSVILHAPNYSYDDTTYAHTYQTFKNELLSHSNIQAVSSTSTIPGVENSWSLTGVIRRQGVDRKEAKTYYFIESDPNFIEYFDFKMLAGKSFAADVHTNSPTIIINDKAREELGFDTPESAIGEKIIMEQWGDNYSYSTIIGVIDNYKQQYGKKSLLPTIFWTQTGINLNYCLKLKNPSDFQFTLAHIKTTWARFYPSHEFSFFFLKDFYNKQYNSEFTFARLISGISLLSLLIACLGIYGIFMVISSLKFKEVGIRKILGASGLSLSVLLLKDFLYLIVASNLIGLPLAYLAVNAWLNNYASRIELGFWFYVVPTVILVMITVLILLRLINRTVNISPILAIHDQ